MVCPTVKCDKTQDVDRKAIEGKIGLYPDFPKKGILFRDIMPILGDSKTFKQLICLFCTEVGNLDFDRILGIESRGFLIGSTLSSSLNKPFGPIRKKGKLPGDVFSVEYDLEYGSDVLEVQKEGLPINSRCLIVDDLLATGGTMAASKKLVEMSGSKVTGCLVVIELSDLKGREKLGDTKLMSLFKYGS